MNSLLPGNDPFQPSDIVIVSELTGFLTPAAVADPTPVGRPKQTEHGEERAHSQNPEEVHHYEVNSPEKPINARERDPAMIRTRPIPRATSGTSDSSIFCRTDAINTRANVRPRPPPTA